MTILLYELAGADSARPFSPHCWKTVMSLAHKGLDFERISVPFTRIGTIEDGASKLVPVIRDGDRIVADSFAIALYLEETYPDRPSLFGGPGGVAMARFVERWSQLTIHTYLGSAAILDIHAILAPADQAYFRENRENRFGKPLEEVSAGREERLAGFRASIEPLRSTLSYQPFIGGASPLFADYIVFGALQWARIVSPFQMVADEDPVAAWFERCLDLYAGLGRSTRAAA
jgi:glutathione S-transferase